MVQNRFDCLDDKEKDSIDRCSTDENEERKPSDEDEESDFTPEGNKQ